MVSFSVFCNRGMPQLTGFGVPHTCQQRIQADQRRAAASLAWWLMWNSQEAVTCPVTVCIESGDDASGIDSQRDSAL